MVNVDDEAFLEADSLTSANQQSRIPTDIADIIADSDLSEQRHSNVFRPNGDPFGRFPSFITSLPGFRVPQPPRRRPKTPPSRLPVRGNQSTRQRTPHSVYEAEFSGNSLVGSSNFDVISGGVFRRADDTTPYVRSKHRPSIQRGLPSFRAPKFNEDGYFNNFKDFADISHRSSHIRSSAESTGSD